MRFRPTFDRLDRRAVPVLLIDPGLLPPLPALPLPPAPVAPLAPALAPAPAPSWLDSVRDWLSPIFEDLVNSPPEP